VELGQFFGPYHGRFNLVGRWAYWQTRDIDIVLREHGYLPQYRTIPPV
jgi:hypothetical protein